MNKQSKIVIAFAMAILLSSGCSQLSGMSEMNSNRSAADKFNKRIKQVATDMVNRLRDFDPTEKSVAVTTFLNLNNFEETSAFGRYTAEELASELFNLGLNMTELRQRLTVKVTPKHGEIALSREAKDIMRASGVDAVVTGAYSQFGDEVVVNARLLEVDSARVIAVGRMVVTDFPNGEISLLLKGTSSKRRVVTPVLSMSPGKGS